MIQYRYSKGNKYMKKELPICPAIFPMPVILIATYNDDGSVDVMNAAWGCAFDMKQIELNISDEHQTTKNIRKRKAFTVSLANQENMIPADYVGMVSGGRVKDKFEKTQWKAHKSEVVDAPILDDLPYSMECTLECFKEDYGIIGNVVRLLVDDKYIDESGKVDLTKMRIISYDPFNHGYYVVGEKVGQAFSEGRKIK